MLHDFRHCSGWHGSSWSSGSNGSSGSNRAVGPNRANRSFNRW